MRAITVIASLLPMVVNHVAVAQVPLRVERIQHGTNAQYFWPTLDDYNGDGVEDLLGRVYTGGNVGMKASIISGTDGATIREYFQPPNIPYTWMFIRGGSLPDSDGDGKREIVLGDPNNIWAVRSSAGGGRVDQLAPVFHFSGLPFGQFMGISNDAVMIDANDDHKLLLVDPRTGQPRARVVHDNGWIANSAVNVGDINGDGVADFASSGGDKASPGVGRVFLFNGALTTDGNDYVPLNSLPAGSVLAELSGIADIGNGAAGHWENTTVNLGDPNPHDSLQQFLFVSGSPYATNGCGALAAHVLTRGADASFITQLVATHASLRQSQFASELLDLGDVNGDGVHDLAEFESGYKDSNDELLGRIQVISGASLLDGFDPATDVIQTIDGLPDAFFYGSFQNLGDYDHDGRIEIAVSVAYNGLGGEIGFGQQVFEVVPEPNCIALCACAALLMSRRARHDDH